MATFNVGDRIKIDSASTRDRDGEIVALRHAVGNTRTGSLSFGADVLLRPSGNVKFFYLHDITRWNLNKLKDNDDNAKAKLGGKLHGPEGQIVMTAALANAKTIETMQHAESDPNGRSPWLLLTLDNGEVMFACFPLGDTFEGITQSPDRGEI